MSDPLAVWIAMWTKMALRCNPVYNEMNRWLAEGRYELDDMMGKQCNCNHCMEQRAKRMEEWYR